jgi:uncharacterized RDD family membrane protein YckC
LWILNKISMARTVIIHENGQRTEYELAGFWERFAARIIDYTIVSVVVNFTVFIFLFLTNTISNLEKFMFFIIWLIFVIPADWLYYALSHSNTKQSSFGQKALKIKVCSHNGNKISFLIASKRHFTKYLVVFVVFSIHLLLNQNQEVNESIMYNPKYRLFLSISYLISLSFTYLVFFFSEKNQCLHDSMSGTYVVKARPVRREYDILEELVG